jgi:NTP pyrophosphatase (non-canonical NTP hydrolase)
MKLKEYEAFVRGSAKDPIDKSPYSFIGLAGETGEVMEWYKKVVMRSKRSTVLTEEDLLLELGDVLHYVTRIASAWGWTLKDCMAANKAKLEDRYAGSQGS